MAVYSCLFSYSTYNFSHQHEHLRFQSYQYSDLYSGRLSAAQLLCQGLRRTEADPAWGEPRFSQWQCIMKDDCWWIYPSYTWIWKSGRTALGTGIFLTGFTIDLCRLITQKRGLSLRAAGLEPKAGLPALQIRHSVYFPQQGWINHLYLRK